MIFVKAHRNHGGNNVDCVWVNVSSIIAFEPVDRWIANCEWLRAYLSTAPELASTYQTCPTVAYINATLDEFRQLLTAAKPNEPMMVDDVRRAIALDGVPS